MTRWKKILIIGLIGMIFTYFIYFTNKKSKINLVAIGDGIASGETDYNIDGTSYNDYVKENYSNKKLLHRFNNDYAYKNYKISDLIYDITLNDKKSERQYIKQIIHQANILTIGIGEEELVKLAMTNDLNIPYLKKFIREYDNLLYLLKQNTEANIVIVGFYENKYLDKSKVIILNSELSNLAIKYHVIFINISDLLLNQDYFVTKDSYYFNYRGHEKIAEMIIHSL